jgi:streptogramin lyase
MGRRLLAAAALVLASLLGSVAAASAAPTEVTEYGAGSIGTPHALVVDGGGNLWFSEGGLGAIGRVTSQGQITSYSEGLEGADPAGLIVGPAGDIWFGLEVDNSRSYIGRIAPTGAITLDQLPIARTQPERLAVGPEGNVWFISSRYSFPSIGYVTPLGAVAQFELPRRPLSLAAGAGANMWFTAGDEAGAAIGEVVLTEGGGATVTLVRSGLSAGSRPEELTRGPDGNLWFTDEATEAIGQVTPSGQITELPIGSRAEQIVPGAEGNLWIRSPFRAFPRHHRRNGYLCRKSARRGAPAAGYRRRTRRRPLVRGRTGH